jgi:hypothetical protein
MQLPCFQSAQSTVLHNTRYTPHQKQACLRVVLQKGRCGQHVARKMQ